MALRAAVGANLSLISRVSGDAVNVDSFHQHALQFDVSGTVRDNGTASGCRCDEERVSDGQVTSRPGIALGILRRIVCLSLWLIRFQYRGRIAAGADRRDIIAHHRSHVCKEPNAPAMSPRSARASAATYEVGGDIADAFDALPRLRSLGRARHRYRRRCPSMPGLTQYLAGIRSYATCAALTTRAIRSLMSGSVPSSTACARWRTRCGIRIVAPRSPRNPMRAACSP